MKLTINNKTSVVLSFLLKKSLIVFLLFAVSFTFIAVAAPLESGLVNWLKTLILPLICLTYYTIDILKYSQKTYFETQDNGINIHSGNLTKNNQLNLLYSQIKSMNISQPFRFKIFGICSISVFHSDGLMTSAWGFNLKEAKEFIDLTSKNFKIEFHSSTN